MSYNPFDITRDCYEFRCPNCHNGFCLTNWSSEYGEPIDGDYEISCPDCSHEFGIAVETSTRVGIRKVTY